MFPKNHQIAKSQQRKSTERSRNRGRRRTVYTFNSTHVFDSVILYRFCMLTSNESTCNSAKLHSCISGNWRAQAPNGTPDEPWAGHVGSVLPSPYPSNVTLRRPGY